MDKTLLTVTAIGLAHAAYEQLTDFMTKAMDTWMDAMPSNPMTAGFKDAQGRAMQIAKENAESVFTFAGKISNARTPQDIVTLQTQFAQDRMQAFVTQTQHVKKLSRSQNAAPWAPRWARCPQIS
jgi:hypothetical protein